MGLIIQLSSLFLLFFQSIVTPYIIGLQNYGIVVTYILPLLLVTAILEPFFVKVLEENSGALFFLGILSSGCVVLFSYFLISDFIVFINIAFLIFFFITSLLFRSICYSEFLYRKIAIVEAFSVLGYIISLVLFYLFDRGDIFLYINSLLIYSLLSSILYFVLIGRRSFSFSINLNFDIFKDLLASISWKSYHIYINIVLLFFVSFFYGSERVAILKIIFSILSGLKFIIPFTLPMFYNLVKSNYNVALKEIYKMIFYITLISLVLYFLGKIAVYKFSFFKTFLFVFDDILVFLAYPMVIISVYIGSFFVYYKRVNFFLFFTTLSIILILIPMAFGYNNFGLIFFVSVAVYQILSLIYLTKLKSIEVN